MFKLKFLFIVAGEGLPIPRHVRRTAGPGFVCRGPLLLWDNGGSTINRDGKWPGGGSVGRGGLCGLGGWGSWGGGGGVTKELEEVEDSACVKAALNYASNHQSARQRYGTRGLDISPTCEELAQHFTGKAARLTRSREHTHTHTPSYALGPAEMPPRRDGDINLFVYYYALWL